MKRTLIVLSLSLAACGSEEKPPPPLFGGFTPQATAAVIFAPAVCSIFGATFSVSAIGLGFASYADPCAVVNATRLCGTKASSTTVLGVALSGAPGGGPVAPAGAGTYRYLATAPTSATLGSTGEAAQVGAAPTCTPLAGSPQDMSGGSITIATVDSTHVTGSVDMTFANGSVFQRSFDATVCAVTPPLDVCALLSPLGCIAPACVP